jgi:hypothetical protein
LDVGPSLSVSEASPSNSNGHSISSTTTIASVTDSAISTATAATSVFLDEASEVEEPRKTVNDGDMWINDDPVVGSPVNDVDVQPMSKAEGGGPSMALRLDSLSTIHSMSVRKGGDGDEVSADDLEELDGLDGGDSIDGHHYHHRSSPHEEEDWDKEEGQDENKTVEKKFSKICVVYAFTPTTSSSSINFFSDESKTN